jgi:hypothetical protein
MRHPFLTQRSCVLGMVLMLGGRVGLTEDMAGIMPADAKLYVGWSEWVKPDSPALRLQEELVTAAARVATRPGAEAAPPPWLAPLLELLQPLETGAVGIGLFDVKLDDGTPAVEAALVAAGPDVQRLSAAVHNFFAQALGAEQIEQHGLRGVSLECVHLPNAALVPVWGLYKDYFMLALGDTATLKVIDAVEHREPTLSTVDEFAFDRHKLAARADGRHMCVYADVKSLVTLGKELARQMLGGLPENIDQMLDELGITSIRSKYVHFDEQDGRPRLTAFADIQGPLRGLLKLWDQKPLLDDDIRIVPQDAYWAQIANVDLAALWQEAQRVLDVVAPDKAALVEGPLAVAQRLLGFSIPNELLPALGDTWALFDAPEHGGILVTGTVLAVEVRDPQALQGMLERVVQVLTPLAAAGHVSLELKQLEHGPHTIHYLLLGGQPVPVAPAWGFAGQRCVFGLFPQTVATALRQADPQTRGPSLLDQPDFQAARPKLPPNVQSIGYLDAHYFLRAWYYPLKSLLQTAGVSALAPYGVEIDLALLPPLPEAAADVTNYVSAMGSDPDGILYASIGSGASLPVVAGMAAVVSSIFVPTLGHTVHIERGAIEEVPAGQPGGPPPQPRE